MLRLMVGERKELHLLRHLIRRPHIAQVVEQAPLRSPLEQQGIAERGVVRLAKEGRSHGHEEQQQQPRQLQQQHARERGERHQVLGRGQEQRDQPDAPHRLTARPLEVVVGLGVLVLREVEGRGVLHQPHAEAVREQVAEQTLEQRRQACEPLTGDGNAELEPDQASQVPPVHHAAAGPRAHARHDAVDDELADPQHREWHERPNGPQPKDRHGVPPVGLEHQLEERRDVLKGVEPLPPRRRLAVGTREQALGRRADAVGDEAWGRH